MRKTRLFAFGLAIAVICVAVAAYAVPPKMDAATRVLLKHTEPHGFAVMGHVGPYTDLPAVITKLLTEMDKGGYLQSGPIMTGFISNIETTPAKNLRWQVLIPVAYPGVFGAAPDDKMGFRYQDPLYVAFIYHIGPYDTINESYKILFDWAKRNNYKIEGFPVEVYWSDPTKTPKEKMVTEIWIPIEEKKTQAVVK